MFKNKSKIDNLTNENARLLVKKQKIQDRQNEENSKIETEIKELENLAFRKKQVADGKVAEIDRLIEKNIKVMQLEADFYNRIAYVKEEKGGKNNG